MFSHLFARREGEVPRCKQITGLVSDHSKVYFFWFRAIAEVEVCGCISDYRPSLMSLENLSVVCSFQHERLKVASNGVFNF